MDSSSTARAKILYLIGFSTGLFFIDQLWVLLGISCFQLGLYAYSRLSFRSLASVLGRFRFWAVIVFISHILIPSTPNSIPTLLPTAWFSFDIYLQEIEVATTMLIRIFCLMTASIWVRDSERQGEFISALRWIFIPEVVAIATDAGLQLSTRSGGGRGKGQGGTEREGSSDPPQHSRRENGFLR